MNNRVTLSWLLLGIALTTGCSTVSDIRPEVVRKSERYLEQGVEAYNNSDYVTATDFFTRALAHYRSYDELDGMLFSHINLAETAMAAGSYDAVQQHLSDADRVIRTIDSSEHEPRLTLLWAQSHWREGNRDKALATINPLLPHFNAEQEVEQRVDTLALTALMLRTDIAFSAMESDAETALLWLRRLENAFTRSGSGSATPLLQARLNRFRAQWYVQQGELEQADILYQQALNTYRPLAKRPAIAATLRESASLAIRRQQWDVAEDQLLRALFIRVWILDRFGTAEVLATLSEVYRAQGRDQAAQESQEWAQHVREGNATDWRSLGQQFLSRPLTAR